MKKFIEFLVKKFGSRARVAVAVFFVTLTFSLLGTLVSPVFIGVFFILVILACATEIISAEWSKTHRGSLFLSISWFWGIIFIVVGASVAYLLTEYGKFGAGIIITTIAVSYIDDVMATLIGSSWDKLKIAKRFPRKPIPGFIGKICPTKSVQGTIAGLVAGAFIAGTVILLVFHVSSFEPEAEIGIFWQITLIIGTPVAVFFGDFLESLWKRKLGFKDSGDFLRWENGIKPDENGEGGTKKTGIIAKIEDFMEPHGGFFDRFDSTFLAVTFVTSVFFLSTLV